MSGRFDQFAMIALLEEVAMRGQSQSSGTTRLWANMEWALEGFPGVNDIVEYESRLNYVLPNYDMPTVCTYDVNKFSASVIMDILRVPIGHHGGCGAPERVLCAAKRVLGGAELPRLSCPLKRSALGQKRKFAPARIRSA
jgi:hypothetical protein